MSGYLRNGVRYNSEDEAELAAVIPNAYLHYPLDAGAIAEAIIDSDWFAEHNARVRAEALREAAQIVEDTARQGGGLQTAANALTREAQRLDAEDGDSHE